MSKDREEGSGSGEGGRFQIVQPHRDPQTNWQVDLAKKLEEYLLKICTGEVTGDEEDVILSVNFAEAALMIQGSVQVYSRKVEYLYSLVVHVMEFLSQKRQQEPMESTPSQPEGGPSEAVVDEEDEPFLGLDDVPVEAKNSLDGGLNRDDGSNPFVKPPANLVVLEGDCFDAIGDVGELESYLLATHDLYQDFILLDPCDSAAVHDFLKGEKACSESTIAHRGSSLRSKTRKSFLQSPTRRSGGIVNKSPLEEQQGPDLPRTPPPEFDSFAEVNNDPTGAEPPWDFPEPPYESDSDEDDPFKPLNPHEPGNFKAKPFKRVNISRRQKVCSSKQIPSATPYPVARLNGTVSPDLTEIWEAQLHDGESVREAQSPPPYEKLRHSLAIEGIEAFNTSSNQEDEDEDNEHANNTSSYEHGIADNIFIEPDVSPDNVNLGDDACHISQNEVPDQEVPDVHASNQDQGHSDRDSIFAGVAATETQTELATRISAWTQRMEHSLEEQDSHPPFDIDVYGKRVLERLSVGVDDDKCMSFSDVVSGQEKYEVARTFSALLQLVNNGNTDLIRGESSGMSVCYTAENPFHVRLLSHQRRQEQPQFSLLKKRVKSPMGKHAAQGKKDKVVGGRAPTSPSLGFTSSVNSSEPNGNYPVKQGKNGATRRTPEGKRRRRSILIDEVNM